MQFPEEAEGSQCSQRNLPDEGDEALIQPGMCKGPDVEVGLVPSRSRKGAGRAEEGRLWGEKDKKQGTQKQGAPWSPTSPTGSSGPRKLSCYGVSGDKYQCSWQYDGPEDSVTHLLRCW